MKKVKEKFKIKTTLLIAALLTIFLGNTIIISQKTIYIYERLRDSAIVLIMLFIFFHSLFYGRKEKENRSYYFTIANLALMIITIHFLRISFGGLLC